MLYEEHAIHHVSKNAASLACYNFETCGRILIFFGRNVTDKVSNERHSIIMFVINWICSFLSGRGQQCKVNGLLSNVIDIGLSIVQGSGIGPTLYIVMKNDLCTVTAVNDIFKYADDTTLLVPQHTS